MVPKDSKSPKIASNFQKTVELGFDISIFNSYNLAIPTTFLLKEVHDDY